MASSLDTRWKHPKALPQGLSSNNFSRLTPWTHKRKSSWEHCHLWIVRQKLRFNTPNTVSVQCEFSPQSSTDLTWSRLGWVTCHLQEPCDCFPSSHYSPSAQISRNSLSWDCFIFRWCVEEMGAKTVNILTTDYSKVSWGLVDVCWDEWELQITLLSFVTPAQNISDTAQGSLVKGVHSQMRTAIGSRGPCENKWSLALTEWCLLTQAPWHYEPIVCIYALCSLKEHWISKYWTISPRKKTQG